MKTNIQKQHKEKDMEHMNVNVIRNNEKIKEKQK